MKLIRLIISLIFVALLPCTVMAGNAVPRTIIAIYAPPSNPDDNEGLSTNISRTKVHKFAEMPLNHLGLILEYHEVNKPLPDLSKRDDVRGVISWFEAGTILIDPIGYLEWATKTAKLGKKFVIMGDFGFTSDSTGTAIPLRHINNFLETLGLQMGEIWTNITYDVTFVQNDPNIIGFERKVSGFKPSYYHIEPLSNEAKSYLIARNYNDPDTDSHLVVTTPHGGYVAEDYALYNVYKDDDEKIRQWYINPFTFFRAALQTDDIPKPDTTTIAGRRIYYSHIDGDGWNNLSQMEEHANKHVLSADVIRERAIEAFPDFPVTIAAIAADLDKKWAGSAKSIEAAEKLFALSQVEVASHTYSHPFQWNFFADGDPDKEIPFLSNYTGKTWKHGGLKNTLLSLASYNQYKPQTDGHLNQNYDIPRAFAAEPFSIEKEIIGAFEEINKITNNRKKVAVLQWSGDTTPFPEALRLTREAGIPNINGGDSRFDKEFLSNAWVSPIGKKVADELQIYASNSNENTYTDDWTQRYHGFRYLIRTVQNTESPIRLKPFNIYYHMYSGERRASLQALLDNLQYAREQELAPITTSHFARLAEGFFSTNIIPTGTRTWRIEDKGKLTTLRFDNADALFVDFQRSKGIIGQRHYQGSLYVYMDEAVKTPILALHKTKHSAIPYLIDSRWHLYDLKRESGKLHFTASGYGAGEMRWHVSKNGTYEIRIPGEKTLKAIAKGNKLSFTIPANAIEPIHISIKYKGA